jgi:hypothetical protein
MAGLSETRQWRSQVLKYQKKIPFVACTKSGNPFGELKRFDVSLTIRSFGPYPSTAVRVDHVTKERIGSPSLGTTVF